MSAFRGPSSRVVRVFAFFNASVPIPSRRHTIPARQLNHSIPPLGRTLGTISTTRQNQGTSAENYYNVVASVFELNFTPRNLTETKTHYTTSTTANTRFKLCQRTRGHVPYIILQTVMTTLIWFVLAVLTPDPDALKRTHATSRARISSTTHASNLKFHRMDLWTLVYRVPWTTQRENHFHVRRRRISPHHSSCQLMPSAAVQALDLDGINGLCRRRWYMVDE